MAYSISVTKRTNGGYKMVLFDSEWITKQLKNGPY